LTAALRVALVHDWLSGMRGGERVLAELCAMYPEADLFTLLHEPGSTEGGIENRQIFASPLNRPWIRARYRKFLPLFPWAICQLEARGYDLVLSTHHAVAKALPHSPGTPHLCYCFTPMRYVWDQADAYLGRGWKRLVASPLTAYLRRFDRATSGPEQVDRFVGISEVVVERIRNRYGREAGLVYPPVDVERFRPRDEPEDFYLLVGGFVPYKREDIAIDAFRGLDRRLIVAGDGPGRARLAAQAPDNVSFTGRISDAELSELYARCRALIYPQEEDFGIVPLEAQASGRPVIAFGRGGATETVRPLANGEGEPTGVWFDTQSGDALRFAVQRFERDAHHFSPAAIRRHAESFAPERFREGLQREVAELVGTTQNST
jgi:glycosyltransferase involved in cell wall biosynthesis